MAKERVLVVLENLGGSLRVAEACRRLRISPGLFHRQRVIALTAALRALTPRSSGRPVRKASDEGGRTRDLEAKIGRLEEDLAFARVREELALLIPWTRRRQKKSRAFRAFWRATMPPEPFPDSSIAGATPGPRSPGASV